MPGLVQDWPLTVHKVIDHAANFHGDRKIVSADPDGTLERTAWSAVAARAATETCECRHGIDVMKA
jgi:hypothetical protein